MNDIVPIEGEEEVTTKPGVLFGIVLYINTEGNFGFQDMHEQGASISPASPARISALIGAAHDMNLANTTAEASLNLQRQVMQSMREAQAGIVAADGQTPIVSS